MAAITSLALEFPNSKTFTFLPVGFIAPDTVEYINMSGVVDEDAGPTIPAIGRPRLRITTVQPNANRNGKVTLQVDAPVLANTSPSTSSGIEPAATRAYNPIFKGEFFIPRQAGTVSLSRLLNIVQGLMSDPVVSEAVVDGERPW